MKAGRTSGLARLAARLIVFAAFATGAAAQLPDQSFAVVPESAHATVGDPVSLRFRVRLDQGDVLYDSVPKPVSELPGGVRILSVEKLERGPDRIYTGRARIAFYRPGRHATPVFGLPFMRSVKGLTRGLLTSDSAFVEVDPVAPPGNPSLKDIKPIVRQRGPDPLLVTGVLAAALAAAVTWLVRRRRGRRAAAPAPPERPLAPVAELTPYDAAVARLEQIRAGPWPGPENVDGYYEAVADTLRRYLEEAHGVPALKHTTAELLRALPPALGEAGLGERCAAVLGEADRVKFARERRDARAGQAFAADARALLDAWHAAGVLDAR
ncbi:MAG TPA: hypothetical protein VEU27_07445 [Gemmatimonadales bacterium]|nr:hypothetical protein [Gemmatimonadales bacterium]